MTLLPLVALDDLLGVDGEPLVRVHHYAEEAGIRLKKTGKRKHDYLLENVGKSNRQIREDGRYTEEGDAQVGDVRRRESPTFFGGERDADGQKDTSPHGQE